MVLDAIPVDRLRREPERDCCRPRSARLFLHHPPGWYWPLWNATAPKKMRTTSVFRYADHVARLTRRRIQFLYVERFKRMNNKSTKSAEVAQVAATLSACTSLFFAMGDAHRQQVIILLAQHAELNVTEITEQLPLSRPTVSHHLKVLRQAGLIGVRRSGTEHFYALTIEGALGLLKRFVDDVEKCD
jgi:ArsR family transcriptional regulator, arsenate/arsenite/antimonite-responsive transcriptional repressor